MSRMLKLFALIVFIGLGNMCFTFLDNTDDPPAEVISCQNCHLNTGMGGIAFINETAHDAKDPGHKFELTTFMETNTFQSAAVKNVDLNKLSIYFAAL